MTDRRRPADAAADSRAMVAEDRTVRGRLSGLLTMPEEGWAALLGVVVLMVVTAVAIDQATWAGYVPNTRITQTSFLPVAVVLAALVGYVTGRSRMGTFSAHLVGSAIGAAYLLIAISGSVSTSPALELRLQALNQSIGTFLGDVLVRGVRSAETSIFLLLIGSLLWAAAQLGAFAIFRRHRAGPAIGLGATALLINMSVTIHDQLPHLVIFVATALLLVVRTSLRGQVEQWKARRIADSGYASQMFMRTGAGFVAVAIVLSMTLAVNASSAPLRPMWDDVLARMIELGIEVNHFIGGVSGPARGPNLLFTPTQSLREQWETSDEPVFTAITGDGRAYKWRGGIYDYYDGNAWQHVVALNVEVPAFAALDASTSDRGLIASRREVLSEITSVALQGSTIVAPADPIRLSENAVVQTTDDGGLLTVRLTRAMDAGSSYVVTSRVFDTTGALALTAADLARAGRQYGPELERYVSIEPGTDGLTTKTIADRLVSELPPDKRDPYHIAKWFQDWLHAAGGFEYDSSIAGLCTGENKLDCFLREKRGFCQQFATALTMMLRTQRIPARYVVGYLPGRIETVELPDGEMVNRRVVQRSAAHAWVEVYFPGYGWYPFDPTPGLTDQGAEVTDLPSGPPQATRPPDDPLETPNFGPTPNTGAGPVVVDPNDTPPPAVADARPALVLAAIVLGLAGALILFARRRRLPGTGQLTYDSVARFASRIGYGPLPAQTAYEYADQLAVVVPAVRNELQIVATAKVEAVYARREPSDELRLRLAYAYRRVRTSLVRLFLRRPRWLGGARPRRPDRRQRN